MASPRRRVSPKKRSTKRKSPRKSMRKSARKNVRKSTRKVSKKCPCCNRVRCTCPKNCKACKNWHKKMRGGSSCGTHRQQGGSSCGTHRQQGAGCGKQHGGVKNSGMESQSGPSRPKRASATKASVALSQARKDREKRSQKIKLTKEFKKALDVEIDRLADMMGTSKVEAADNLMDDIGMYMNTMTMGRRQQQSSSKQLPPSRINFFKRQPSRTEYTAQDVLARFK